MRERENLNSREAPCGPPFLLSSEDEHRKSNAARESSFPSFETLGSSFPLRSASPSVDAPKRNFRQVRRRFPREWRQLPKEGWNCR